MTLPSEVELLVVGAGLMGSMTAWAAAGRGLSVAVLEQYGAAGGLGSSHGSARIVRRAYPDRLYVEKTGRAFDLWKELEKQSGQSLLRMTGGLDHGGHRDVDRIVDEFVEAGVPHELMPSTEAEKRWPGMKFETEVLFHEQAGTVDPDHAVHAALDLAAAAGAAVVTDTAVTAVTIDGDCAVVETAAGDVRAGRVVLAPGAWLSELSAGVSGLDLQLPPLRVSQQQVFHFARRDGIDEWPTSVHKGEISTYSLAGGRDGGPGGARKVAEHDAPGMDTSARNRSGAVDPAARERIVRYVQQWMPGLVPDPFHEATCLYTSTANDDFLLDRVGPLVICSPCSGHGAKFAPLIGEMATDLALGISGPEPRFALSAHR